MPLFMRVFAVNAALLVGAAAALVLTPATVSFPVAPTEAAELIAGLTAILAFNFVALRRVFRPLARLTAFMRGVDPLRPGRRAPRGGTDRDVADLTNAFNDMIERVETERRESARRALTAQEEERLRISRELHDEVGQRLTAVMLQLEHAPEAREQVRIALEEVRELGIRLRPEALDDLGLAAALRSLVTAMEQHTPLNVVRDIHPPGPLEPEQELVAYRVAQEALTNAARHAGSSEIRVELRSHGTGTLVAVQDRGRGLDGAGEGSGVRGMRERALLVGGDLEITSLPGGGTRVQLVLGGARRP
jgi:two-component system, NarL family, sensor histidine kinase UhpB